MKKSKIVTISLLALSISSGYQKHHDVDEKKGFENYNEVSDVPPLNTFEQTPNTQSKADTTHRSINRSHSPPVVGSTSRFRSFKNVIRGGFGKSGSSSAS